MSWRHRDILEGELHEAKGFTTANNGDSIWRNEEGLSEWTDREVLPAALNFVDASVAPPTTANGDIYVLSLGASIHANWGTVALKDWVRYDGSSWNVITPSKSILCYDKTLDVLMSYDGSVWASIGGGGGEVNTSSNSGAGEGLALSKVGSDLPFKSITAGTGITLTSSASELEISSAGGSNTNLATNDLTQTDLVRTYTRSSASGISKLRFKGVSSSYQFEDAGPISLYTGDADVNPYPGVSLSSGGQNTGLISFRGGKSTIQGASSSLFLRGFANNSSFVSLIELGADILINPNNNRILKFCSDKIYFKNSDNNTYYGRINDDVFIWSSQSALPAAIGSEKFSIQEDTLVKGSDTSASTTGFKVTDSTNASLLEVKNNGVLNASNLPTSSAGLSSGDIWNNSGVLNIV